MNTITIPTPVYEIENTSDVLSRLSDFTTALTIDYSYLFDDLYGQEIFGLKTTNYDILTDIFILADVLVRIYRDILNTPIESRLTYKEYMQQYHLDCMFKGLMCKHVNIKPLMVAFDSGYSNVNNTPSYQQQFIIQ